MLTGMDWREGSLARQVGAGRILVQQAVTVQARNKHPGTAEYTHSGTALENWFSLLGAGG